MLELHQEFIASSNRARVPAAEKAGSTGITLVTTAEGLSQLRVDYERLGRSTRNRIPFALHDWHVTWWAHFAASGSRVNDSLRIFVVRDASGHCVAIIPFVATDRHIGPLRLRTMSMLGPDPYISELRGPLVEPGHEAEVVQKLRRHLAADDEWDWILWSGVCGAFADALRLDPNVKWLDANVDHLLDLPPTWAAFQSGLKRNIRESLRHCYNSLKREGIQFEFEVARKPADVALAVEHFLRLHAMRARMTDTVSHRDRFDGPKTKDFLREVCSRLALRDVTRVFMLKIGGEVVAARIGFVVGESLYLYFSGFNPDWRKYSVMTTTVAEAIKYAIDAGIGSVSLSAGTDVSKTRWGARPVEYGEAIECRRSMRSQIAHRAYRQALAWRGKTGPALERILEFLPTRRW